MRDQLIGQKIELVPIQRYVYILEDLLVILYLLQTCIIDENVDLDVILFNTVGKISD